MRPDEPGDPLIVSGTVRSTSGEPLPGAILDIWQIDANCVYPGLTTEDFRGLDIPNDSTGIPKYNLRARIIADSDRMTAVRGRCSTAAASSPAAPAEHMPSPIARIFRSDQRSASRPPRWPNTMKPREARGLPDWCSWACRSRCSFHVFAASIAPGR
ncbi:hypothetical protein [Nonomuraea sp. NPDC049625]|uniref:dioxygenase family protein n=1 Tax=Nonomuraea sp. NPDC049625 TaxID=3155775 RepID=UPI00342CAEB1